MFLIFLENPVFPFVVVYFLFLLNISVAEFLNFLMRCWFLVCLVENLIWVFLGFLYYEAFLCGGGVAWNVFAVFFC